MTNPRDDEFTEFVIDNSGQFLRTAWLLTGDLGHAEDLVQTALAKAYSRWPQVQRADHPAAFVRRLMVNSHLSWRRRLTNSEQVIEVLPDAASGDLQAAHADSDETRRALAQLSTRVRTAIVLRFFDDLSEATTAELMGCSVSTVNNHVTRGLATLRALLSADAHSSLTPVSRRRP
ncbi:SigE family RNA polymerase sigma factor [Geodermatophilus sp. FMUSA9-8]|uniref:SigE family RNA polymerase sigma factor n=1 Tax=Geodermatophilus sp. FMUSA9-8 TaxID=3120155 RepID=UPI00300AD8A2